MANQTVSVTVHEKEFEVTLIEKDGKVFAKTHINNFGEIQVPDLGGGKEKALENIRARIWNVLTALESDEAREARKREAAQAAVSSSSPVPAAAPAPASDEAEGGIPPEKPELN